VIYPTPDGTPLGLGAAPTTVGKELGLVANEPLGSEWFVLVASAEPLVPPEIQGRAVDDKAVRYEFGGEESPGRNLVLWLIESFGKAETAAAIVPLEVVGGGSP
jgi:hypothetical protein